MQLDNYQMLAGLGRTAPIPAARIPALIDLKSKCDEQSVKIITFVETWIVVDPRLAIFQTALNFARHDIDPAWNAYFQKALQIYPTDLPQGTRWALPSKVDQNDFAKLAEDLTDKLGTLTCYAIDFKAEMQTLLVGGLFGHKAPVRQPMDPRLHGISLTNTPTLDQHFDQAPWSIAKRKIEDDVRQQLAAQGLKSRV